ncbi:MAG: hypothetical protein LBL37_04670 [Gracilibacteraceae bacterium]|jgi:hypothetical protein|nr:hypothetical protein [Gracilibacteraceae bacterium]
MPDFDEFRKEKRGPRERIANRVLLAAFILFLCLPPAGYLLVADQSFSEIENRYLTQFPALRPARLWDGSLALSLESYLADQFPGRSFWVQVKTAADACLGKKDIGGAYIGSDGRLFEKKDLPPPSLFRENITYMLQLAENSGISCTFLPVYSAAALYPEYLPPRAPLLNERLLARELKAALPPAVTVVDPWAELTAARAEDLYFRTDHHWTQTGAYHAFLALAAQKGWTLMDWQPRAPDVPLFFGALYAQAPLPWLRGDRFFLWDDGVAADVEIRFADTGETASSPYIYDNLSKKDLYTVFLGGNHSETVIRTAAGAGRRLLILKDSFAHALVPFLLPYYDEITMIDLRYFRSPLSERLQDGDFTEICFIYNIAWFAADDNFRRAE